MTDRTREALEVALKLVVCAEAADMFSPADDTPLPAKLRDIHDAIAGALSSLKQQPVQVGSAELAVRLHRAVRAAGSETALAKRMGIKRQSLSDVLSGRRAPGPAVLAYLHMKKVETTRFEPIDPTAAPSPALEPKPKSERRQRAWDMLPRLQEGASA